MAASGGTSCIVNISDDDSLFVNPPHGNPLLARVTGNGGVLVVDTETGEELPPISSAKPSTCLKWLVGLDLWLLAAPSEIGYLFTLSTNAGATFGSLGWHGAVPERTTEVMAGMDVWNTLSQNGDIEQTAKDFLEVKQGFRECDGLEKACVVSVSVLCGVSWLAGSAGAVPGIESFHFDPSIQKALMVWGILGQGSTYLLQAGDKPLNGGKMIAALIRNKDKIRSRLFHRTLIPEYIKTLAGALVRAGAFGFLTDSLLTNFWPGSSADDRWPFIMGEVVTTLMMNAIAYSLPALQNALPRSLVLRIIEAHKDSITSESALLRFLGDNDNLRRLHAADFGMPNAQTLVKEVAKAVRKGKKVDGELEVTQVAALWKRSQGNTLWNALQEIWPLSGGEAGALGFIAKLLAAATWVARSLSFNNYMHTLLPVANPIAFAVLTGIYIIAGLVAYSQMTSYIATHGAQGMRYTGGLVCSAGAMLGNWCKGPGNGPESMPLLLRDEPENGRLALLDGWAGSPHHQQAPGDVPAAEGYHISH